MNQSDTKKVLLLYPSYRGGVQNYCDSIIELLNSNLFKVDHYHIGKRSLYPNLLNRIFYSIKDLIGLCKCYSQYDLIHINTTLGYRALIRDGFFHLFAKRFYNKKTIVFFHGWSYEMESGIDRYFIKIFKFFFNFNHCIVLANSFKKKLIKWGYAPEQISVDVAMFDEKLLDGFRINERKRKITTQKNIQFLFISRIEKAKGIIEAVETIRMLSIDYPNIHLTVAGDGKYLNYTKSYCKKKSINNVSFAGYVDKDEKRILLRDSDIMLFPTYYLEGMPSVLVEAMAFGIPVITRPVGGIPDIFIDGKHGFMTNAMDPYTLAQLTKKIINDRNLWWRMSNASHKEIIEGRFFVSRITKRLITFYRLALD